MLGKNHVIKDLKKCDFTPMYEHAMAEREKKKQLSKEVCLILKDVMHAVFVPALQLQICAAHVEDPSSYWCAC